MTGWKLCAVAGTIGLVVVCAASGCKSASDAADRSSQEKAVNEAAQIVQLAVASPQLGEYFHFTSSPDRLPLVLVNRTGRSLTGQHIMAGGQPATVADDTSAAAAVATALVLDRLDLTHDRAELGFRYAPEGIQGTAKFQRSPSGWAVSAVDIVEH